MPLPQPELIEWHRQELGRLKQQSDELGDELQQLRHELINKDAQIESFQRGEAIPTTEELAANAKTPRRGVKSGQGEIGWSFRYSRGRSIYR